MNLVISFPWQGRCYTIAKQVSVLLGYFGSKNNFKNGNSFTGAFFQYSALMFKAANSSEWLFSGLW